MSVLVTSITRRFGNFTALDDVSLDLRAGEIHALLGANGSGKSTLAKILSGVQLPDSGTLTVDDRALPGIASPHHARTLGIAVVHQDAPLIDTLSVAECVALFRGYPTTGGRILWSRLLRETASLLERHGIGIAPTILTGQLSAAERALVSLVIALDQVQHGPSGRNLSLLILDEVTAALPERQAETFLDQARVIAGSGVPVLMVTHRLMELNQRADRVTVLRNGCVVHADAFGGAGMEMLMAHMAGPPDDSEPADGELRDGKPDVASSSGPLRRLWGIGTSSASSRPAASGGSDGLPAIAFEAVSTARLRPLDWSIAPGEIVGLAGLAESGVQDVPAMLAGACRLTGGRILVRGRALPPDAKPWDTIGAGITVLPSDRLHDGGVRTLSASANAVLPDTGRWWHRARAQRGAMDLLATMLDIRPRDPEALFGTLSGGNQQKVLLGKWLLLKPSVLVLDDPTQGVDPGAREMIFRIVRQAAAEGVAVLMLSTEPEQLARLCARVLVLQQQGATELRGSAMTYQSITGRSYA